uniref:Uncharacterized protein n=1 Tax=Rhizophora mucronata TaxID=61149 RepID=A0A2P2MSD6_RHIMU
MVKWQTETLAFWAFLADRIGSDLTSLFFLTSKQTNKNHSRGLMKNRICLFSDRFVAILKNPTGRINFIFN